MRTKSVLTLAVSTFALTACNPFSRSPVTEVSRDVNANARWSATLATPAALAGAVQMNGTASMQPAANTTRTDVTLQIANATPGGQHPWQVHRGRCDLDYGVFGRAEEYGTMKIGNDGRGHTAVTTRERTPTSGDYFVVVYASVANPEMVVACGNLSPPTR